MIEQKLDRIIELLEIIADAHPKKRRSRADMNDHKNIIKEHINKLHGKMTFDEICKIIGIANTRPNRSKFGSALTELKIEQTRTKYQRYYHFD